MMRRRRLRRWCILLMLVVIGTAVLLRTRINPLTRELAQAKITDAASNVINQAVNQQIREGNIQYDKLVTLQRDQNGNITALTTNMQEMNRLKTQLLELLDDDIYNIEDDEISIPLGNLTGIQLLSGRGPSIPVKIIAVSSSDAQFQGEFSDAGINQTIHRIMMEVSLDLIVLLPSGTVTDRVSSQVCVAETVLLGPVPDTYAYLILRDDLRKRDDDESTGRNSGFDPGIERCGAPLLRAGRSHHAGF